jgi:hypothetical protein
MPIRTWAPSEIAEKTSLQYTTTLTKETGATLTVSDLSSLTLTHYALDETLTIINSVNGMDILNANLGTIDGNGLLTITLRPADTAILVTANITEERILLIQGTYDAGLKATRHEVKYTIRNLAKVT